jgi:hypothetical protein
MANSHPGVSDLVTLPHISSTRKTQKTLVEDSRLGEGRFPGTDSQWVASSETSHCFPLEIISIKL